jgi:hypothetical protein
MGGYETHDTICRSKQATSEAGSNDPYQFLRPKYYQHKPKVRTLSGAFIDTKSCSVGENKTNITSGFKKEDVEHVFEDDIHLFLEIEREAQKAYLQKPDWVQDIKNSESVERKNLLNVLNNQIINKQTKSEIKPKR